MIRTYIPMMSWAVELFQVLMSAPPGLRKVVTTQLPQMRQE